MATTRLADRLASLALGLPEAWEDHPWEGDRVAKVRKKIFAFLPHDDLGSLGVKLPHSSGFAASLGCVDAMGYGLGRHGWMVVHLDRDGLPDPDALGDWVIESYCAVAPKALTNQLAR